MFFGKQELNIINQQAHKKTILALYIVKKCLNNFRLVIFFHVPKKPSYKFISKSIYCYFQELI